MNGINSILYLESFVDSTAFLPPDLQRQLNTIKALDEKCLDLSETVHQNVAQLMSMPPQHQHGATEEYIELSRRVEQDQRMLLQFAEEKVQVAQQVYDLIEMHAIELEKQIDDFEGDIRVSGLDAGGMESYYGTPGFVPLDSIRGRTPKLDEWAAMAPTPVAYDSALPPMPNIRRSASTINHKASQKRPRDDNDFPTPVPSIAMPAVPQMAPVPSTSVAAVTPVAAAAAAATPTTAVATMAVKKRMKSVQSLGSLFNSGGAMEDGTFPTPALEQEPVEQPAAPVGFLTPPPPGLQPAAPKPQAIGKYLYQQDITQALKGRHAELFWPPDSMWYLIEIQDVNVDTKIARIVYTTGDVEELDLDEIARDMHMSIISNDMA